MSFQPKNSYLYCERLRVKDIQAQVSQSPFYLYSLRQITNNYNDYAAALKGVPAIISYAFKANSNLSILKLLRELGAGAVLVSENELRLALAAGFDPKRTVFNGNGKTIEELTLAAEHGVMINVDSEFDLEHIEQASKATGRNIDVLIRINPDIDPDVHPYVSTGIRNSKFGVRNEQIPWFLERLRFAPSLNLVGIHCHLGSTIRDIQVFRDATFLMMQFAGVIRQEGFDISFLNIGGGLGVDYERKATGPSRADLINAISDLLTSDMTLIIEPGRSIIANAGVLVSRVIGVKTNGSKHFIVVDASMAELIRPSLYDAYHHIEFIEPVGGDVKTYEVVGPVCESADFLGKNRRLATPDEGVGLVIYDTGAYGYAMSSNYNSRMRPAEYLVDGDRLIEIRRAEKFDDYARLFESAQNADEG